MSVLQNGKPSRGPRYERQYNDPSTFSLTDEEKAEIREKARLTVAKEMKDREEQTLLDLFIKEEREKHIPEAQLEPIWLNLSPHMEYIRLDDKIYCNETTYYVTGSVFAVLTEQMARGWAHEEETEVRDSRTRRRAHIPVALATRNYGDNRQPRDLKVSSAQLAGVRPEALLGI